MFNAIFDVGRRIGDLGFNWADDMTSFYHDTLIPLVGEMPQRPTACLSSDKICKDVGVSYDPATKILSLCDSWFDDRKFPSAKLIKDKCKGDNFYSLRDVQNSKGRFTALFPLLANMSFPAQAIINALVRTAKYRSTRVQISDRASTVDDKPVDLATNLQDSLKLADQSLTVPGKRGTQSQCPNDATKNPKSFPYRCSLWNVRQWGFFAQGKFDSFIALH